MMAVFEIFKPNDEYAIIPLACAVEMIHTYSLIHDDLPAMDDDDYRRGKLTNHKVYGEAMAILAGDALLNKAVETILQNRALTNLSPEVTLSCLEILMMSAGTDGMIGGQVVDMFVAERSMEYLEYMHRLKTGALIRAACQIGAVAGGASEDELSQITDYANYLGLAFQVKDDILDVTAIESDLGKPTGSDEKNDKLTYVTLLGLVESESLLEQYTKQAIESVKYLGDKSQRLVEMAEYLLERKK
jgi:geranylgeranyl diphosphate synthase type II